MHLQGVVHSWQAACSLYNQLEAAVTPTPPSAAAACPPTLDWGNLCPCPFAGQHAQLPKHHCLRVQADMRNAAPCQPTFWRLMRVLRLSRISRSVWVAEPPSAICSWRRCCSARSGPNAVQ